MIELPPVVAAKAAAVGASAWVQGLDSLVADLAATWSLSIGATYADATEAYVAEATLADGTPGVLKVVVPRDGDAARHEITVLRMARGEGCARLLFADESAGAFVTERLGPALSELDLPVGRRLEILCAAAQRVWRPAPDAGLPSGADKARWLAAFIVATWVELERPCAERTVEMALACAARREAAHDAERAVLLHGDVHQWNALRSLDGFKLVDPDGLVGEIEYDLGVLMREDPVELLAGDPRRRSRFLARRCGADENAIWEWGVVERVSTGLLCTQVGLQPVGREMLEAADRLAPERRASTGRQRRATMRR